MLPLLYHILLADIFLLSYSNPIKMPLLLFLHFLNRWHHFFPLHLLHSYPINLHILPLFHNIFVHLHWFLFPQNRFLLGMTNNYLHYLNMLLLFPMLLHSCHILLLHFLWYLPTLQILYYTLLFLYHSHYQNLHIFLYSHLPVVLLLYINHNTILNRLYFHNFLLHWFVVRFHIGYNTNMLLLPIHYFSLNDYLHNLFHICLY